MTLINASLLLGLVLAAVPVILHLVMRAKPKRLEFPALRLLKARRPSNARRMQLRHLLLLLLRALVIAVLVLAIVRPSLPAARYGLRWWEWLILATTVLVTAGVYFWLNHRDGNVPAASVDLQQRRGRRRLWCVVAGAAAALVAVGVPWGIRVRAELTAPRNEVSETIPVAAVFLVDTSVSMHYRHENKTRLQQAQAVVEEHLSRLPQNSRAAIAGLSADDDIVFQADLAGAASRLETLEATPVPESINRRLKTALESQTDDRQRVQEETGIGNSDQYAREVYVISDFSRAAWQDPDETGLADALKKAEWLQVYLVDVSVPQPVNVSLSGLQLSEETTVSGRGPLLTMTVSASPGASTTSTAEIISLDTSGQETRLGAPLMIKVENGATQVQTEIRLTGSQPFIEGIVRLTSEDPLSDDNERYFTCGLRPKPKVLLISDLLAESQYIRNALQPTLFERSGIQFCEITSVKTGQGSLQTFSNFDAVFVINCQRPDESLWNALKSFATSGGGVFVVAGSKGIQPGAWSTPSAKALLPATPVSPVAFYAEPGRLRIENEQHPVVSEFTRDEAARAELASRAFDRCWAVEPARESSVLLSFTGSGDRPALLERSVGQGRCLLFASAMDNLSAGGNTWNNLVVSWSFVMLTDRILSHLTGATGVRRNFVAGELIDLPVPVSQRFDQYLLRRPGLRQTRGTLAREESSVLLTDAVDAGHYRIKPFESPSTYETAFSVNIRDEESDLVRITDDRLNEMLGTERVAIVHDAEELQRAVRVGRLGIEIFPVLMGLLVLLFSAEHLMANFFYDEPVTAAK
jgi:hypothetical protein